MHALIIAESTPKLMKLAAFARTTAPTYHWRTGTTGPFSVTIERFDTKTQQPRLKLRHRISLNRILALAADVDAVFIATDPTARGERLAADLADQLLARYPDVQIKRLRLKSLAHQAFSSEFAISRTINRREAESARVAQVLNFLVSKRTEVLVGRPVGRSVLPLLSRLSELERPGLSRIRVRLAGGLEFLSQFGPTERMAFVLERLGESVPVFTVSQVKRQFLPPVRYDMLRLQQDGCRILGARSMEVASQFERLYCGGYVGRDESVDRTYGEHAAAELRAFGDEPGLLSDSVEQAIVPVRLSCLPSDVPKLVRPVYRLIWANTLCSFARPMDVQVEQASFVIDDIRFDAQSVIPLSSGFDHVSFGLFYRRGGIDKCRTIEEARMFGGGPFESELLERLDVPLRNPAVTLKAAENAGYIGFDGIEVALLDRGRDVLDRIGRQMPQLLDGRMFAQTERYIESNEHDVRELLGPWSWWADEAARAVKRKNVAYLR